MTAISKAWHTSTSLTSITPLLLTIYLYSASKWWYRVLENTTYNKQKCLHKGTSGCEVLCVEGKGSSGIFDMTSSLLNSLHFLKLVLEITFKGGVVPHLRQGTGYNWGRLGESPHHTLLLPDFTPWLGPPGVLIQAGPPSVFVTHCSQL